MPGRSCAYSTSSDSWPQMQVTLWPPTCTLLLSIYQFLFFFLICSPHSDGAQNTMQNPFWSHQLFQWRFNRQLSCLRWYFPPINRFAITLATPHCLPQATMFSLRCPILRDKVTPSLVQTELQIYSSFMTPYPGTRIGTLVPMGTYGFYRLPPSSGMLRPSERQTMILLSSSISSHFS